MRSRVENKGMSWCPKGSGGLLPGSGSDKCQMPSRFSATTAQAISGWERLYMRSLRL